MATRMPKCVAKAALRRAGVDFTEDFHALRRSQVDAIVAMARKAGYRKRADAPGSRGRMFFEHLKRQKGC